MRNVTISVQRGYNDGDVFELAVRDSSTGEPLVTVSIERDALGHLAAGELVDAFLEEHAQSNEPRVRQTMEQLIEVPLLPDHDDARDRVVAGLLRRFEVLGWKGNRSHVGDKNRIHRVLPGVATLYRVEFERFVPEAVARAHAEAQNRR